MKKGDLVWAASLGAIVILLLYPATHSVFVNVTKAYPYSMGFVKVAILATMGELLAARIVLGVWKSPPGLVWRAIIWGLLGMSFVLIFEIFSAGVASSVKKGLLPAGSGSFANFSMAFFISTIMNLAFAPTMMALHRITDTYLDLAQGKLAKLGDVSLRKVVSQIDWQGFIGFVVVKTIPLFWIPAHTVTFLLPPEYRVLVAAFLSIALGAILAFAKRKPTLVRVK
jgi:hypothetical protein